LIQGVSGAGKSWTLRRLLEQTAKTIQQIVIDPEGEFRQFAEALDILHIDGSKLDLATLALVAGRIREHRASVVLDLAELDIGGQMQAATAFIGALISAPKEHWHPAIVAIDEAQLFAPHGGHSETPAVRKASVGAMADLMSRGRKRGLGAILATHRLARLAKSVASPVLNFMIGLNTLDLDIRRAAENIGWDARKAFDKLPALSPGDFVAVGPAFSISPTQLRVGQVETPHVGATPKLTTLNRVAPAAAAKLLDLEALLATSAADAAMLQEDALHPGTRAIRSFIRDHAFPLAGQIWGELLSLSPSGALLSDLSRHLKAKPSEIAAALALLDLYGAVEFTDDGKKRAARISGSMSL
jgi:DNA helicase HerA-like ATPase